MEPEATPFTEEQDFFLAVNGDGGPTGLLLRGVSALRQELSEQFYGPEGPQTDEHAADVAARWESVCDIEDRWDQCHGRPFSWHESGDDYAVSIYLVTGVRFTLTAAVHEAQL